MKEVLIGIHLVGLSMSFVKALTIDLSIARQILLGVSHHSGVRGLTTLRAGFGLLLFSGVGLILLYWFQSPELLANPKLWAKSLIVLIAGLNGYAIERLVLARSKESPRLGRSSLREPRTLMTIGLLSVSWASWIEAFALGVWKSINFVASFNMLIVTYLALIVAFACLLGALSYHNGLKQRKKENILLDLQLS